MGAGATRDETRFEENVGKCRKMVRRPHRFLVKVPSQPTPSHTRVKTPSVHQIPMKLSLDPDFGIDHSEVRGSHLRKTREQHQARDSERCATDASTRRWRVCWIPPRAARGGPLTPRMASSRPSPRASCWSAPRRSCWCVSHLLVVLHFPVSFFARGGREGPRDPLATVHLERAAAEAPRASDVTRAHTPRL